MFYKKYVECSSPKRFPHALFSVTIILASVSVIRLKIKDIPHFKLVFTLSTNHAVGWGTETYESILKVVHVYSTVFKFYVYIVLKGRILSSTDGE